MHPNPFSLSSLFVTRQVHERNLTCDFLMAVMKAVIRARPTLKLFVMSAVCVWLFLKSGLGRVCVCV